MANIALTGLTANDPVPGNYLEINWAAGEAAGFQGDYPALLIGNKTSAGSATVETVVYGPNSPVPCTTEQDVINLFGTGSELHRMFRRFTKVNKTTAVHLLAVAEGGGAAAATLVITFATNATAAGSTRVYVGDEFVDVPISSGDTVTTIAATAKALINAQTHWPVTADNSSGVLTITSKNKGPRANQLRGFAVIFGTGVGTTSDVTVPTFFTSGATEDSYTNALATILAKRYYYIVSASNNSTQLGALITQVNNQALPVSGIRQRVFAGHNGTSNAVTTLATGRNAVRAEIVWLQNSEWHPAELAANAAAVYSLYEAPRPPRHNFSGFGNAANDQAAWFVPAPLDGSAPTRATIKSLLENGVTPIGVNTNGSTYIVKRITTRCLNGSTPDFRIRDAHRVTENDFFADDLLAKLNSFYVGKDLADDPPKGQQLQNPAAVCPAMIRGSVFRLINDYGEDSRFKKIDDIKAGTVVQRSSLNTNRVEIRVPTQAVDILDQTATALDQVA